MGDYGKATVDSPQEWHKYSQNTQPLEDDTQRVALMDIRDALVEIVKLLQEYLNKSK